MSALRCRASGLARRNFHSTSLRLAEKEKKESEWSQIVPFGGLKAYLDDPELSFSRNEATAGGHMILRQQRQLLYYMRLIEHEMPKLVAFRKPFVAPTKETPLVVRSISYGGEEHPATTKRVIVAAVANLPLKDDAARHSIKLIAGSRWTPTRPRDSGVGADEAGAEHGFIKISCEDFPRPAMNLKWASDALDRLITEANNAKNTLQDIPVDTRHVVSRAKKHSNGEHLPGRFGHRPSIKDFPQHWLPDAVNQAPSTTQS